MLETPQYTHDKIKKVGFLTSNEDRLHVFKHTVRLFKRALTGERGWEVEVVPLVAGQRSVREKEWLELRKPSGSSIGGIRSVPLAVCCSY
jgi:hypothetical protein